MNRQRRTSKEKGITLIALIITIVVLLILAVVAIRAVQGDGIIAKAKESSEKYSSAQLEEEKQLLKYEYELAKAQGTAIGSLGEYALEKQIKEAYNKDIKIGDYVNYDETKGGTITGINDVQWRVLGIEDGKVLLVSATNAEWFEDIYKDVAVPGYDYLAELEKACDPYGQGDYAVDVRSITDQDINNVTGYNPLKTGSGTTYHEGRISQYGNEVTYRLGKDEDGNKILIWESKVNPETNSGSCLYDENNLNFVLADGTKLAEENNEANKEKKEMTFKTDYYWYHPEVLINLDPEDPSDLEDYNNAPKIGVKQGTPAYEMLFENTEYKVGAYWLASKYYFAQGKGITEGLRSVTDEKVGYEGAAWYLHKGYRHAYKGGARPVVTLSENIQFNWDAENLYWAIEEK